MMQPTTPATTAEDVIPSGRPSLLKLFLYFLRLGSVGFGGPIALAGRMQQDLVEQRGWFTKDEYLEGLALAQLAPGPLAAQLAMYLGFVHSRVIGATLVAVAFVAPSFVMVLAISAAYVRYESLPWLQAAFRGIGPVVIAIIARSAMKLSQLVLKRDRVLWTIAAVLALTTAITQKEIIWLFVAAGLAALLIKTWPVRMGSGSANASMLFGFLPSLSPQALPLLLFFAKAGLFVFGSGLAIVPFLHGAVVLDKHWLDERQFLDAVAIAMITPGPVVITVAFIGYLVAGLSGATAAAVGVFLPVYLVVIALSPSYRKVARHPQVHAFVGGVTAAATGAIAGAVFVLARSSIHGIIGLVIAVTGFIVLRWKLPEPLLIAAGALLGLAHLM